MNKSKRPYNGTMIKSLSIVIFLVAWQTFCFVNNKVELINPVFLPGPIDIVKTIISYLKNGTLWSNISASLIRIFKGYVTGVIIAVILGYFMGKFKVVNDLLDPLLGFFGSIPPYAFCPLFIIWFGIGEGSKVSLITYTTIIPMVNYIVQGMKSVDPLLIRSARSLGANELQVLQKVIIPSSLPYFFNGLKTCLGPTFGALIVAEMMGASTGLGFIIVNARNWFLVSDMFMSMMLIALIYTVLKQLIVLLERYFLKWQKSGMNAIE